jgi:membrane-bound ClpP family serine protease
MSREGASPVSTVPQQGHPDATGGPAPRNGMGLAALILGVIAILTCWIVIGGVFGLLAIVLGVLGASRARRGRATNRGVAITGIVTGAIGLVLAIVILVTAGTLFVSFGGQQAVDCVQQAGGDQTKLQQCGQQIQDQVQGGGGSGY